MSNKIIELNQDNFAKAIVKGITVVDFYAPWCGPCRQQGPILEGMLAKIEDDVTIAKFNIESAPEIAGGLGVQSIPTIIIFKDGNVWQKHIGVQQEATLLKLIEEIQTNEQESTQRKVNDDKK